MSFYIKDINMNIDDIMTSWDISEKQAKLVCENKWVMPYLEAVKVISPDNQIQIISIKPLTKQRHHGLYITLKDPKENETQQICLSNKGECGNEIYQLRSKLILDIISAFTKITFDNYLQNNPFLKRFVTGAEEDGGEKITHIKKISGKDLFSLIIETKETNPITIVKVNDKGAFEQSNHDWANFPKTTNIAIDNIRKIATELKYEYYARQNKCTRPKIERLRATNCCLN